MTAGKEGTGKEHFLGGRKVTKKLKELDPGVRKKEEKKREKNALDM